jgi:heat shock protein HslJ
MDNFGFIYANLVKAVFIISIGGFFNLTACLGMDSRTSANLEGQKWILEEINGKPTLTKSSKDGKETSAKPYLELDFAKNRFSGRASCNGIWGEVKAKGNEIRFVSIGSSVAWCELIKQERAFIQLLKKVTRFELSEQTLNLYAENKLVLKFSGEKDDNQKKAVETQKIDLKLETGKWVLTAIAGRPMPQSKPETFIFFDQNWSFNGNSYCHSFGGGYKTGGDSLSLDAYQTPTRLQTECLKQGFADQTEFFESLPKVRRFEIKDGKLNMYGEEKLLLTFEFRADRKGNR